MSARGRRGAEGTAAADRRRHYTAAPAAEGGIGSYSRFVGLMRYLLPAVAMLLLGLVVAWPLADGERAGLHLPFGADAGADGALKMIAARYTGTDTKNRPFTITAAEASQPSGDSPLVHLTEIEADILVDRARGERLAMTADAGLYRRDAERLDLTGEVVVHADSGHSFRTTEARVDLPAGTAAGDAPVRGQGPYGLLDANNFMLRDGGRTMTFGGRVRMTIFPDALRRSDDENA